MSPPSATRLRLLRALLLVAHVASAAGCMRDTINGGVTGQTPNAGARASGSGGTTSEPTAGSTAGTIPGAGAGGLGPGAGAGAGAGTGGAADTGGAAGAGTGGAADTGGRSAMAGAPEPMPAAGAGAGAPAMPAAGSRGASGSGMPSVSPPILRDGAYVFAIDEIEFEIDPTVGGRLVTCAIAGQNLLTGSEVDALNYGSTFWPSPQERWNWPPIPELDSEPYTAMVSGDALVLTSRISERAKLQVTKRFRARPSDRALEIEYELANHDASTASWAPWEITRVPAGGLSFFPAGERQVNTQLPVLTMGEVTWYQHDPSRVGMGQKFSADGKDGWLAHVAGEALLVKAFPDIAPAMQAPAPEAEVALYAAAGYVELEPQGPYTELMPGESVRWNVRWYVRKLPEDVSPALGSAALVDFVRSIVAP